MSYPPSLKRQVIRTKSNWLLFWLAIILFIVGLVGTFVTANGGWGNVLAGKLSANWTIVAIVVQAILTISQWVDYNKGLTYASRAIDTALTAYAYGAIVWSDMVSNLMGFGIDFWIALYSTCYIICVVSLIVSWYPEYRLVRD